MKKLLFLLLLLSFLLLSGCAYRYTLDDVDEMKEQWSLEYADLEEKYNSAYDKFIDLDVAIAASYDDSITVKAFFLGWDESSFAEAKQAFKNMYDRLYPGEW